jgi:pimeloyl-ACP methyl ester carboxylesterase
MSEARDRRPGPQSGLPADVSGVARLLGDAVVGVTDIVEEVHRNIAAVSPIVGAPRAGRTRGIPRLVYRSVRGVTRAVGPPAEVVLAELAPLLDDGSGPSPRRERLLAALNGGYGDYLVSSGNPLAIPMRLRRNGQALVLERSALAAGIAEPSEKLLVLVHGLCMNDLQWTRAGHDHGSLLGRELGYSPLYLHYNSGRHVSENGREFAVLLERLVREWPVPVRELVLVGHSMGGLVSRSACHYAMQADRAWLRALKRLVFLGTPHHGAPLERAGNRLNLFCEISPYAAPFARLGAIRSAGVKDLRHGNLVDEDWQDRCSTEVNDARKPVPLPSGMQCFVVAADRRARPDQPRWRPPGDGLVPVESALGRHVDAARALPLPPSHQHIGYGLNHFDLLDSPDVYRRMQRWLAADPLSTME